jgi:hypothetical protein
MCTREGSVPSAPAPTSKTSQMGEAPFACGSATAFQLHHYRGLELRQQFKVRLNSRCYSLYEHRPNHRRFNGVNNARNRLYS